VDAVKPRLWIIVEQQDYSRWLMMREKLGFYYFKNEDFAPKVKFIKNKLFFEYFDNVKKNLLHSVKTSDLQKYDFEKFKDFLTVHCLAINNDDPFSYTKRFKANDHFIILYHGLHSQLSDEPYIKFIQSSLLNFENGETPVFYDLTMQIDPANYKDIDISKFNKLSLNIDAVNSYIILLIRHLYFKYFEYLC
jgi:hypothetical protein